MQLVVSTPPDCARTGIQRYDVANKLPSRVHVHDFKQCVSGEQHDYVEKTMQYNVNISIMCPYRYKISYDTMKISTRYPYIDTEQK